MNPTSQKYSTLHALCRTKTNRTNSALFLIESGFQVLTISTVCSEKHTATYSKVIHHDNGIYCHNAKLYFNYSERNKLLLFLPIALTVLHP